jgi:hypothetical protein
MTCILTHTHAQAILADAVDSGTNPQKYFKRDFLCEKRPDTRDLLVC